MVLDVMDFVIGGLSAGCAGFFSNPLDVLKTRMQLQGELKARGQHSVYYKNVFHAAFVVAKNEGVSGLQKGVVTAVILHSIRNSIRLGLYQTAYNHGLLTDDKGKTVFYKSFIVSSLSGAAGAFVGSPLFMVKTQLQSRANEKIAVGFQHKHEGAVAAFKTIYNKNGIRGLWRGWNSIVVRAIAGSGSQLTSFLMTKDALSDINYFSNKPYLLSLTSSIIGGIFQTLTITPFDLVATRIYNQGLDSRGNGLLYKGIIDCCIKVWKTEGFLGFYKGIGANYMRLAPHSALTLVFWDYFKDQYEKYKNSRQK